MFTNYRQANFSEFKHCVTRKIRSRYVYFMLFFKCFRFAMGPKRNPTPIHAPQFMLQLDQRYAHYQIPNLTLSKTQHNTKKFTVLHQGVVCIGCKGTPS